MQLFPQNLKLNSAKWEYIYIQQIHIHVCVCVGMCRNVYIYMSVYVYTEGGEEGEGDMVCIQRTCWSSVLKLENNLFCVTLLNLHILALADVAQWIECPPANQRVTRSSAIQGTCLSCGPGPQLGACEKQPHTDVSLHLFLLPFPSLSENKNK